MRRARNQKQAVLAVVCFVMIMSVAIALQRAGGEGEHGTGDDHGNEAVVDSTAVGHE